MLLISLFGVFLSSLFYVVLLWSCPLLLVSSFTSPKGAKFLLNCTELNQEGAT